MQITNAVKFRPGYHDFYRKATAATRVIKTRMMMIITIKNSSSGRLLQKIIDFNCYFF